jgi:quinoprotein glucose dehydrogenase
MKAHTIAAVLLLSTFSAEILSAQKGGIGWKEYLGGPDSSHYSPLKQINRSNVGKLDVAWSYNTGDSGTYFFSPLVVDNIAYVAAKQGALVAVDAATGKELWVHAFPAAAGRGGRGAGISGQRGANYWESKDRTDRRIFVTTGGFLYAIDARTGQTVDSFADDGRLDLKTGIDRAAIPLASRTPGRIFENLIILGSATGEGYLPPPGDIRAFDVRTGKLAWVFHTIPRPGEIGYDTWPKDAYKYMGGVDVGGEITVDEKRGIAYFPVASAKYELYGGDRPGNNLFADCLLALDARTGKHLWHFQTVHHDIWDYDPTAAPQLATVKHDGKSVDIVALAGKNGFLFVFDRVTGKPLWPIEERPVPKSEAPGEWTSPTQPFPTVPPPFARQSMTVKDLYDGFMTPEEKVWWTERLSKAQSGLYTPPSADRETIQLPSVNGGAFFFNSAADPAHGIVYVQSKDLPSIVKLVPAGQSTAANAGSLIPDRPRGGRGPGGFSPQVITARRGRTIYEQSCQACHGPELKGDRGPRIDTAVATLGTEAVHNLVSKGKGSMPAVPGITAELMTDLLAFMSNPEAAPLGSALPLGSFGRRGEPDYPEGVAPPPSRYKTGYGTEPYVISPPWSTITAYDLNTGTIKWQISCGDLPQAGPGPMRGNVLPKGGFVVTAGGLIFFAGNEGKLYAFDADTGKVVFTQDLPNGSAGVPAVYEVGGRQYLLLAIVGGNNFPAGARLPPGGVNPSGTAKSYIAFALPK